MTLGDRRRDSTITLDVLGVRLVVRARLEDLTGPLVARLPPPGSSRGDGGRARRYTVVAAEPPDEGLLVYRGRRKPVRVHDVQVAADLIARDFQVSLAHHAQGLVFVHAGAVAWQGRALVLPGRSGTGKSELVAALVRAGAEYLSDEFAVFADDGLVHPYARPMGLRQSDGRHLWIPAKTLGARAVAGPSPPGLIAFLRYSEGSRWRPRRLSAGQTLLGLLRHTVAARRRLSLARSVLVPVAATAAISAVRDEASDIAQRLLAELASA